MGMPISYGIKLIAFIMQLSSAYNIQQSRELLPKTSSTLIRSLVVSLIKANNNMAVISRAVWLFWSDKAHPAQLGGVINDQLPSRHAIL